MPPKIKFTREEMIRTALDLVRESGMAGLSARMLAARLGCSVKPIFGLFKNMEELQAAVFSAAMALNHSYFEHDMKSGEYPAYKASGMAYIRFAKEEPQLFRMLFMRDRSGENVSENREEIRPLLELIQKNTGLDEEKAYLFHLEMWIFVHGIAVMAATSYLEWELPFISKVLTDAYLGIKHQFCGEEKENGGNPDEKPVQTV